MTEISQIICIIIIFMLSIHFLTIHSHNKSYKPRKQTKKVVLEDLYDEYKPDNTYNKDVLQPSTNNNKTKKYLSDNVLNITDKYEDTIPFTNDDIDNYRNSQLIFRENIYNTSHGVDVVDILNYNTLNGITPGQKISDISTNILMTNS